MREADIEKMLVQAIEEIGGKAFKFASFSNAGVPDRIVLLDGKAYFVELKAPGQELRPLQEYRRRQFEGLGFEVFIVDSMKSLGVLISEIENRETQRI